MRKKITVVAAIVAIVAVLAVGSLAYFTDIDKAENVFTVGNVKIDLVESQLHRENAGGGTTSPLFTPNVTPAGDNSDIEWKANDFCFSDEQILKDDETYQTWLSDNNVLLPGQYVRKNTYVKNIGANDAYVRIRVLCPVGDGNVYDMINIMSTQTAINKGEVKMATSRVTIDDVLYDNMVFTYQHPLASGEMTYWNAIGAVGLNAAVTQNGLAGLVENNVLTQTEDGYEINIKVIAEAIQADGFADAAAAFAAFDAQA